MKILKYALIMMGIISGLGLAFFDAAISYADTALLGDNLEPISGFDIPDISTFIVKMIVYALIGAIFGYILWLGFGCFIYLVKKIKEDLINPPY